MNEWAQLVLDWIAAHPHLAGVVTFLIAFVETLLVIGFFIPGTIMLFGVGVLVGQGSVPLSIAAASLVLGGVAGDAIGYWMGRHYRERILALKFFQKRQRTVEFAERMVHRHTGKALLAARLIGQIRPIVPFVAGVADIPTGKFFFYNVLSAVIAAVLHLVPGIVVGIGLRFSGAVTGRLVALLVIAGLIAYLVYWSAKRARGFSILFGPTTLERLSAWTHAEAASRWPVVRHAAKALVYLLDRERLEVIGMAALWLATVGLFIGVIALVRAVSVGDPIADANTAMLDAINGLRNPWADDIMVVLAAFGETPVILTMSAAVLAALLLRRAWLVSTYWALAIAIAFASTSLIGLVAEANAAEGVGLAVQRALPVGHAAISVTILGYFGILATHRVRNVGLKLAGFAAAFGFISLLSIAQLYVGQLYVSGLAGGILIGIAALLILTAATWRHIAQIEQRFTGLVGWFGLIALIAAGAINAATSYDARIAALAPKDRVTPVVAETWRGEGWAGLPAYRVDFTGGFEEPINVQVAATPDEAVALLETSGWQRPARWDLVAAADLITGSTPEDLETRPVLARFWEGRREVLVMVKPSDGGRLVLHLWDLGHRLDGDVAAPLLLGTVEHELYGERHLYGLIALPPGATGFGEAAAELARDVAGAVLETRAGPSLRPPRRPEHTWDGSTVLVQAPYIGSR
ncbi:MAG: VTT domain-containing protein [Alphaproteobacteria bacterium]